MASVFARGFLRSGYPVYPITRAMSLAQEYEQIPSPKLVLVTVQENKLGSLLVQVPQAWRDGLSLVQNELPPPLSNTCLFIRLLRCLHGCR